MFKFTSQLCFLFLLSLSLLKSHAALAQFSNPDVQYEISSSVAQGDGQEISYRFSQKIEEPLTFTLSNQPKDIIDDYSYSGCLLYTSPSPRDS